MCKDNRKYLVYNEKATTFADISFKTIKDETDYAY